MTKFEEIYRNVLTAQLPNICTGIGENDYSETCHRADQIVTGALFRIRKGISTFEDEVQTIANGEIAGCTGRAERENAGCFARPFSCGLDESHVVVN